MFHLYSKHMDYNQHITYFAEQLYEQKQKWIDKLIDPHLMDLLDKAQSRLRRPIKFCSGMGTFTFDLGSESSLDLEWQFSQAVSYPEECCENPTISAIRRRFPELVEFCNIVIAVKDELDMMTDSLSPRIKPRGTK